MQREITQDMSKNKEHKSKMRSLFKGFRKSTTDVSNMPLVKSAYQKNSLLISQPKHTLWYSKDPSQWDSSFEHPKHKFKLMGKKIFTILRSKIVFI